MTKILLNPLTKKAVDAFLNMPSHGLKIAGPSGSGKSFLSMYVVALLLKIEPEKLNEYPYFAVISPEPNKNQISIEQIRQVKQSVNLKTLGQAQIKRVIIIEQAELMGHEAQNALLKLLEEPNEDTVFILNTSESAELLPTVSSRLQTIIIHPVSLENSIKFFDYDKKDVERAWRLSLGYAGLMHSLLSGQEEHELNTAINEAKEILSKTTYNRFLMVTEYSADRPRFKLIILALDRLLAASHFNSIAKNDNNQIVKILRARQCLAKVQTNLASNGSLKLNILYLFTSIG
jgi:DNA polymerase-3 subunit delta'